MKEQKYSYSQRIGKTTFIVNVKQSESAKKPLNTVFQDICKHEVLGGFFTDKSFNLENPQKVPWTLVPRGLSPCPAGSAWVWWRWCGTQPPAWVSGADPPF